MKTDDTARQIARYAFERDVFPDDANGPWVDYEDHAVIVASLTADLAQARQAARENYEGYLAERKALAAAEQARDEALKEIPATEADDWDIGGRIIKKHPDGSWTIDARNGNRRRVQFLCFDCGRRAEGKPPESVAALTADLAQAHELAKRISGARDEVVQQLTAAEQALASMTASAAHWKRVAESS